MRQFDASSTLNYYIIIPEGKKCVRRHLLIKMSYNLVFAYVIPDIEQHLVSCGQHVHSDNACKFFFSYNKRPAFSLKKTQINCWNFFFLFFSRDLKLEKTATRCRHFERVQIFFNSNFLKTCVKFITFPETPIFFSTTPSVSLSKLNVMFCLHSNKNRQIADSHLNNFSPPPPHFSPVSFSMGFTAEISRQKNSGRCPV